MDDKPKTSDGLPTGSAPGAADSVTNTAVRLTSKDVQGPRPVPSPAEQAKDIGMGNPGPHQFQGGTRS